MTYTTKTDVIEHYIKPALGEFYADYDLDAIFERCFTYDPQLDGFAFTIEPDDFYDVAAACDLTTED